MKKTNSKIHLITRCALFAALICILAPFSVPIGPVSVTLGLFAVMLAGVMLNWKNSAAAVLTYIFIGACGLPVFSGAKGGFAVLAGPTGGYLWSYVLSVIIISVISSRAVKNVTAVRFFACIIGTVVCYFFGTLQFVAVTEGYSIAKALTVCVYPFIPFDIVKALCASVIGTNVAKRLNTAE